MPKSHKLDDVFVRSLKPPPTGNRLYRCASFPGFAVRITAAGCISFVHCYCVDGRERRATIGQYPTWSVRAARDAAAKQRRQVDAGEDPLAQKAARRKQPTLAQLYEAYLAHHVTPTRTPRGALDERSMWEMYILPILGRDTKIQDLDASDMERLLSETKAKAATNSSRRPRGSWGSFGAGNSRARAVAVSLRTAINAAPRWKMERPVVNPVSLVRLPPLNQRESPLSLAQAEAVIEALKARPESTAAACLLFLLATGARVGETRQAERSEFQRLQDGSWLWQKPSHHTKQRKVHRIPLCEQAAEVLEAQLLRHPGSRYVFPGRVLGTHVKELKSTWTRVRAEAGAPDCRVHDLRHSFASALASRKVPLNIVGDLLGHTSIKTTQRYAHYDMSAKSTALNELPWGKRGSE